MKEKINPSEKLVSGYCFLASCAGNAFLYFVPQTLTLSFIYPAMKTLDLCMRSVCGKNSKVNQNNPINIPMLAKTNQRSRTYLGDIYMISRGTACFSNYERVNYEFTDACFFTERRVGIWHLKSPRFTFAARQNDCAIVAFKVL